MMLKLTEYLHVRKLQKIRKKIARAGTVEQRALLADYENKLKAMSAAIELGKQAQLELDAKGE